MTTAQALPKRSEVAREHTWNLESIYPSDVAWAQFRTLLDAKAACAGRSVMAVPPQYTSQDCSGCGTRVQKSLSMRTHVCPSCGLVLDRDANAARNILRAGQARRGAVAVAAVLKRASPGFSRWECQDREAVIKAIEQARHPTPSFLIGLMRGERITSSDPGFFQAGRRAEHQKKE
jgi:predicted RNA-binding Zn-ribbon protein involved in translation (DUF1610 family)